MRVTLSAVVAVAIVLALAGWSLFRIQRDHLIANLDNTLRLRADELATAVTDDSLVTSLTEREGEVGLYQVVAPDGNIVAASANVRGDAPIVTSPTSDEQTATVSSLAVDDDQFRVLSRRVDTSDGTFVVHVAASLDPANESLHDLQRVWWLGWPIVVGVLGWLVWLLTGRTLRPIERIRAEVAAMTGTSLDRRVHVPPSNDEVSRLATTMNELLSRIDHATRAQRQFVADASHELRIPLTRLRSDVELLAATSHSTPEWRDALDEVVAVQRLIDELLLLARSDAGESPDPASWPLVDLDDVVLDVVRDLRSHSHLSIDTSAVSAGQVRGDRNQLHRLVTNLSSNAARYAATTITLSLREGDEIELIVGDDGPGVPSDAHELIFERFTRLDEARSRHDGGSGLGLSIARDIARRHGGTISVDPHRAGAVFVVRLPRPE